MSASDTERSFVGVEIFSEVSSFDSLISVENELKIKQEREISNHLIALQ